MMVTFLYIKTKKTVIINDHGFYRNYTPIIVSLAGNYPPIISSKLASVRVA